MPVTSVANNGRVYPLPPTLNIRVNSQLPQGAVLQVRRNGTLLGNASQTGQLTYSYTDAPALGSNEYTVDLVLESTTLNSAPYTINTEAIPAPTIDTVTDEFFTPVLDGVDGQPTGLIFNMTVTPSLLGDAYVDMYLDTTYIGTATRLVDPTKFTFAIDNVPTGSNLYAAQVRVANLAVTSEFFTVSKPAIVDELVLEVTAYEPALGGLDIECEAVLDGNMAIGIAIHATDPSGSYYLCDISAPGVALDLGLTVDLNHVQGTSTYYTVHTEDLPDLLLVTAGYGIALDGVVVYTTPTPICNFPVDLGGGGIG